MTTFSNGKGTTIPVTFDDDGKGWLVFPDKNKCEDFFNCDLGVDDSPMYYREGTDVLVSVDDATEWFQ
jgi:hypothetical protein